MPSSSSSSQSRSRLCCWLLLVVFHFSGRAAAAAGGNGKVPALIVVGDSTVDAGNNNFIATVARGNFPPYGRDFDGGVATGRFSNGRLVTDFLSEALGLPASVPAYLDPSYTIDQLATGVSFASGGTGLDDLTAKIPMAPLHDVNDDSMDEALFEFYKKEKIKELKRKLSASVLMDIKNQKGVLAGGSDFSHNDFGFKSRLQSTFGCFMNDKLLGEISLVFDKYCTCIPMNQKQESEKMIFEILKLVADGFSVHNHQFSTPILTSKRKVDVSVVSPIIANRHSKKRVCFNKENNVPGRVLFQSSEKVGCQCLFSQ